MRLFSIVQDKFFLRIDVYQATVFDLDDKDRTTEISGDFIVFTEDRCLQFTSRDELFNFIQYKIEDLIDNLPF